MKLSIKASELQTLGSLIDAAIKATGTPGAKVALPILAKIEAAVAEFNQKTMVQP